MPQSQFAPTAAALVRDMPTVTMPTVFGLAAMLIVSAVVLLTNGTGVPEISSLPKVDDTASTAPPHGLVIHGMERTQGGL